MIDNQETQEKIAAEVRDLSKFVRNKVELGEYIDVPMPTAFGKPLDVYYAELADRIEAAARRDYEYPKAQSLDADKLTGKNISGLVTDLRQIAKYHYARGNIEQGQFARVLADRIEAAVKRERDARAPKPDQNWKDICAKCKDGDIEPECAYYGEPNGCNSPIYGEHPTAEKSSPVGDSEAMREAAKYVQSTMERLRDPTDKNNAEFIRIWEIVSAALASPPRNCDIQSVCADPHRAWLDDGSNWDEFGSPKLECHEWLLAPAKEQKGENNGSK